MREAQRKKRRDTEKQKRGKDPYEEKMQHTKEEKKVRRIELVRIKNSEENRRKMIGKAGTSLGKIINLKSRSQGGEQENRSGV